MRRHQRVLVRFGYDGARFHGVPPQPGLPTVGEALRLRLEAAAGTRARSLAWASRTDRGVHAHGNLATAAFPHDVDIVRVALAVAVPRADGLSCVALRPVPESVHARNVGVAKRYRYRIQDGVPAARVLHLARSLGRARGPVEVGAAAPTRLERRSWPVAPRIDVARVRAAAAPLVGTHDFSSFAARLGQQDPIREVTAIRTFRVSGVVHIDVSGRGFLRYMVRNIVGLLGEIGAGVHPLDHASAVLAARSRTAAGIMAPARGLLLARIETARDWFGDT